MAKLTIPEPQSATDYDDRTTKAVKTVLVEIGQILGSFKGKFAVIGGAVPWLLLANEEMQHVGTADVDLALDAEALGDGEYATLVEALQGNGYQQRKELRRFQLVRQIKPDDEGPAIDIIIDFLMPRDAAIVKNVPRLLSEFAVPVRPPLIALALPSRARLCPKRSRLPSWKFCNRWVRKNPVQTSSEGLPAPQAENAAGPSAYLPSWGSQPHCVGLL